MDQLLLQEVLLQAIQKNSELVFEADGNKVICVKPDSVYDLDKKIVEVRGSAKIVYLEGEAPNRFVSRRELKRICLWVEEDFKVKKSLEDERIPQRVEESLKIPHNPYSKDDAFKGEIETPPFLRKSFI